MRDLDAPMDTVRMWYLVCDETHCDYEVQVYCTDEEVAALMERWGFRQMGNDTLCPRHKNRSVNAGDGDA